MLVLAFYILIPTVVGLIPGKQCGGVICLDSGDVTCLPQVNTCKCNQGLVGNGRFGCVNASSSCICYLYGDPYVTAFSESVMSAPLPCHHVLAEFTTPNGINVKVSATASSREERPYPGYVFEDGLKFVAYKGTTMASALFRRDGFWNKGLKVQLPFRTSFPEFGMYCHGDSARYWTLEIPGSGVAVRYRTEDSSVTIEAPKNSLFDGERLCGDCGDDSTKYRSVAKSSGLTLSEWSLMKTVLNLDMENEDNLKCRDLDLIRRSCSSDVLPEAIQFCGAPFSHNDIGECFAQVYGKKDILSKMNTCIEAFCGGFPNNWCSMTNSVKTSCSKTADYSVILNKC